MGPMNALRRPSVLALASILVVLSVGLLYNAYGSPPSGPYFPPPTLLTWPMLTLGGGLFGYAVADRVSTEDRRLPRISLVFVSAIVGWTGNIWITSSLLPPRPFLATIENTYRIGITLAAIVVVLVELSDALWGARSSS